MRTLLLAGLLLCACCAIMAQDPEFPKNEFIMHVKLHNGMVTNFKSMPDLYVGGIQLVPQYTVIANRLRLGIIADAFYTDKKVQAAAGPTLSFKLATINVKKFGSGGNINLSLDQLWGTGHQRLFGGGINIDLLNFIVAGISMHRDYYLNSWWIQGNFGFRISKVRQTPHP